MDIVGEGLDMFLKVLQEWQRAAWPRVVNNGVVTGEFRQTLLGLASLWKARHRRRRRLRVHQPLDLTVRPRALSRRWCSKNGGVRQQMDLSVEVVSRRNLMRVGQSRWG